MIKSFNVDVKKNSPIFEKLPPGAYMAKILSVQLEQYDWGEQVVVFFDIDKGEHKNYFAKEYEQNQYEDKKWRGRYVLFVPKEGDKWYDSRLKTWGNFIACLQESNPGYKWDWDETKLKGKAIGVLIRNKEWKSGWYPDCCSVLAVVDVLEGKYRIPKDKPLSQPKGDPKQEDLPF